MKRLLTFAAFLGSLSSFAAQETQFFDGFSDEQIIQSVEFSGEPGVKAQAAIVRMDEDSAPRLIIVHQKPNDARYHVVLDNSALGLSVGMAGMESNLDVAGNGSLRIEQQNDSVGRNRWKRTLTVSFRKGGYVVSGFTYVFRDTLDPNGAGSCDYNLLTGRGTRNDEPVKVTAQALDLQSLEDTEKLYSCDGW